MDTIHQLNTSLPSSSTNAPQQGHTNRPENSSSTAPHNQQPPARHTSARATSPQGSSNPLPVNLHAAFKAAAVSVTQLYKAAAAESESVRETGYRDAITDLLAFLDAQNLGLCDGEGWLVRQWATRRIDPSMYGMDAVAAAPENHVEDGDAQTSINKNGISNTNTSAKSQDALTDEPEDLKQYHSRSPARSASHSSSEDCSAKDADMTIQEDPSSISAPPSPTATNIHNHFVFSHAPPASRANFSQQAKSKSSSFLGHRNTRSTPVSMAKSLPLSLGGLGQGSGAKRKPPPNISDYFDFGALSNTSSNTWWSPSGPFDDQGGGKRGRFE